ncbi:MAG: double-strand break repair protein AddB [Brevundimonas sp.]|uniref:double-strand break repair protein AddB n=1 Tax=Brevundimonas sp. TaxID=1871086 RepID=UPI00391CFFEF
MSRFDPFARPAPRWFSIASERSFLDDLAAGLLEWTDASGPEALGEALILLPNRRAARLMTDAFARRATDRPRLLPMVRALGDLEGDEPPFAPGGIGDDLPPAIGALARRFELAGLVAREQHRLGRGELSVSQQLDMADAVGRLLDSCQIEEVAGLDRLHDLAGTDMAAHLAEHWRGAAGFLAAVAQAWSERLDALGLMDVSARRVRLLNALARQWQEMPPAHPVIAAGSTGTVPAAARVLGTVAGFDRGAVVLPGLDLSLDESAWQALEPAHPQYAMKRLLERHEMLREQVRAWPGSDGALDARSSRRALISESLKPPEATHDWYEAIQRMKGERVLERGLEGLKLVEGEHEEHAALLAATLMREAVEQDGLTCALVAPDPVFARRVQARLSRWGLQADSSAGTPLAMSAIGALIDQLVALACERFSAATVLAVLRAPATRLGLEDETRARGVEALERLALTGPRPASPDVVRARIMAVAAHEGEEARRAEVRADALAVWDALCEALAPVLALRGADAIPLADGARAVAASIEALARLSGAEAESSGDGAFRGASGEAAARLLSELMGEGARLAPLSRHCLQRLMRQLLIEEVVRTGGPVHPRLRILGSIEARLYRADRMILSGLEEGVWPPAAPVDPFLSRPMRAAIGLPSPERRIGLSAHDFAQSAHAREVVLLHTRRAADKPSVRSRWLWRLQTLIRGAGEKLSTPDGLQAMAAALDAPARTVPSSLLPAERPCPKPPVPARPMRLSVTRVEEWLRDPYSAYARHILKLFARPLPDEVADVRLRGTAIHQAMEAFARAWSEADSAQGRERFAALYLDALREHGLDESALHAESVFASRLGNWIVDFEMQRRAVARRIVLEEKGETRISTRAGAFTLTAKSDRMELSDAGLAIIDYKTGTPPDARQVREGWAPQLPLSAVVAERGGFGSIGEAAVHALEYVQVTGRAPPARIVPAIRPARGEDEPPFREVIHDALAGLIARVEAFADESVGYLSRVRPNRHGSDYDHLARFHEWSTQGEDAEGDDESGGQS